MKHYSAILLWPTELISPRKRQGSKRMFIWRGDMQVCRSAALQHSTPGNLRCKKPELCNTGCPGATRNSWAFWILISTQMYVGIHKDKLQLRKMIRDPSSNWSSSEQSTLNFSSKRDSHLTGKTQTIDLSTHI